MSIETVLLSSHAHHNHTLTANHDHHELADIGDGSDDGGLCAGEALLDAVLSQYHRITGREVPTQERMVALFGQPVTLAYRSRGPRGVSYLIAAHGTLAPSSAGAQGLVLYPAQPRSRPVFLYARAVFDVEAGPAGVEELQDRVDLTVAALPALGALTREHLLALPNDSTDDHADGADDGTDGGADEFGSGDADIPSGEEIFEPTRIGLAVLGTWTFQEVSSPAAIWLLYAYDPVTDIADGYLLVNEDHGYSEHGSIHGEELLRYGGRILHPPALTLSDAFRLGEQPQITWLTTFTTT